MIRISFNKVIVLICIVAFLSQPLFFSFMGLLGLEYEGIDSSPIYAVFIVTVFILVFLAYVYSIFKKGLVRQELKLLVFFLFLLALHNLWVIFDPINTKALPDFLIFFVLFGLPGFFAAATVIKLKLIIPVIKATEITLIFIGVGIIKFSVFSTLSGFKVASLAGATYQTLSYYSAFVFGVLLVYLTKLPEFLRFSFTNTALYKATAYILLLGCALGVFIGGGRGAFLLFLTYILVYLSTFIKGRSKDLTRNKVIANIFKVTLSIVCVSIVLVYFSEKEFVQSGFKRATQFISVDRGIDLERGSSGRDRVYSVALEDISERPVFGYGPFGIRDQSIHAHNFFLEILQQFGVVGLILCLISILALFIRARGNWSSYSFWCFSLLLYPIIMIQFSGSYMHSSIFIFGVSFLFLLNKRKTY